MSDTLFLVPASLGLRNGSAAIELLRECYGVVKGGLAPMGIGLVYETVRPVPESDQKVLGIVPWI